MGFKRLIYFKQSLKFQIDSLRDYVDDSKENLKEKQNILRNELQAISPEREDEHAQAIIDNFVEENLKYFNEFPQYFNESTFLIIYSFFESNLARICKYARLDLNAHRSSNLITSSPAKSYISDSKIFLESACQLKLRSQEKTWRKLDKLRKLRNFIAHNNFDLKQSKNPSDKQANRDTINYINRVFGKTIKIDHLEKCKIENDILINEQLNLVENYLNFIIDKVLQQI